jgi:hypothetical protein
MEAGTAFLAIDPHSRREHLWVILSDPKKDDQKVLIVNLTTLDDRRERTCVLQSGDHPCVRHETAVHSEESRGTTLKALYDGKGAGLIKLVDPVSPALLQRTREGAVASSRISLENADVLVEQGLVPE